MIVLKNINRAALPEALLPVAKMHMRITWSTDDEYVKLCLLRAIDLVERHSGSQIVSADAEWNPIVGGTKSAYRIPVQPVTPTGFTATAPGVGDVASFYQVLASSDLILPVFMERSDGGGFHDGVLFGLKVGYATKDDLPPQFLDPILRIAAHFFEHRESVDTTGLMSIPQWMNDLLLGNWIPRA